MSRVDVLTIAQTRFRSNAGSEQHVPHLSGIATLTARFVDAVANYPAMILDTRKTTPDWRELEKYAVRCGGGRNHRMGLYDMVLIKDNHIAAAGGLRQAVRRVREASIGLPIEVKVRSLEELEESLELDVDRVLLDNMEVPTLRRAVKLAGGRAFLEASGGCPWPGRRLSPHPAWTPSPWAHLPTHRQRWTCR